MHVDAIPFTDGNPGQWPQTRLGPVWLERSVGRSFQPDHPVAPGLQRFIQAVTRIAARDLSYGTAYAALLGDEAVAPGSLHYDLGEYAPDRGAVRYVGTWASDDWPLSNVFLRPEFHRPDLQGETVGEQRTPGLFVRPLNRHIVILNEGTDLHGRPGVPARPGEWGVFVSVALYRENEPANLDCPRLAELRSRGRRAAQAAGHRTVARTVY